MSKELCKNYKPEILSCPFCCSKLSYRYTVSNKLVQFSNGKIFRIKNLGYGCVKCNDHRIYVSQTANKLCFKGYTYSAKILCLIAYYKRKHMSRDSICDILSTKGIDISDRNIDILYQKFEQYSLQDAQLAIAAAYQKMLDEYQQIRLSIDVITIFEKVFIIVYDFFSCELLTIKTFETIMDDRIKIFLASFLSKDKNITVIASIRKDTVFIPLLKELCPSTTKFIAFNKF